MTAEKGRMATQRRARQGVRSSTLRILTGFACAIALVLGVDRILDMCRTMVNVTADLTTAVFVARTEPAIETQELVPAQEKVADAAEAKSAGH